MSCQKVRACLSLIKHGDLSLPPPTPTHPHACPGDPLPFADATVLLTQPSIAESAAHDRVISTLAQLHGLRYCPQVPNLALIMLSYLSEAEVFTAMVRRACMRGCAGADAACDT